MARFRLRFLLQEIDLRPGDTLIGRSAVCHVTIEDPLVSRQHSRIRIDGDRAVLEDLGSRNGTFANGRAIDGIHELEDGDRIRVGTLELVFCHAADRNRDPKPGKRTTGFMCHCADCGTPYPAELPECPNCGSDRRVDDDTISGVIGETQRNWTLELLVEVLHKAVALRRWEDVERMLRRARLNIEGRVASDQPVDTAHLHQVAEAAALLSVERAAAEWATWMLTIYALLRRVPSEAALAPLDGIPPQERDAVAQGARRLVDAITAIGGPKPIEAPGFGRLLALQGAEEPV